MIVRMPRRKKERERERPMNLVVKSITGVEVVTTVSEAANVVTVAQSNKPAPSEVGRCRPTERPSTVDVDEDKITL